ncbi:MAG: type II toxin-antitoxin system VapC family toxin [Acidobacteria bacterium]|nr:MAG: type II toxin-antitoxin system VapC family toxin [Acidobacteriota bacterium]
MRLLLDTHALLWWTTDDKRLKDREREAIADEDAVVWVSAASIWEITIKASLGRIELDKAALRQELDRNTFLELPILWQHAEAAGSLPRHHDDPFDRMLIAQAQTEQLVLVSYGRAFRDYDVPLAPADI